jgi:hypothetical protein
MFVVLGITVIRCFRTGTCDTCYEIDTLRRSSPDLETQEQLKRAHHLHRGGLFNLERLRYKARCAEAIASNNLLHPSIMSLILDGMDQNHCRIPYLGGLNRFSDPVTQHITGTSFVYSIIVNYVYHNLTLFFSGIKEHGIGLTIYRNFDNVSKGCNVTIYCLLRQLESFHKRHGYYPETLYLQVDGGSENANQYVLALLELLVVKRCCREVYYTRLPAGHTHEDIDASFGVLWSCFRSVSCTTIQGYKSMIEDGFRASCLHAVMEDIYAVPDYSSLLGPCIIEGN